MSRVSRKFTETDVWGKLYLKLLLSFALSFLITGFTYAKGKPHLHSSSYPVHKNITSTVFWIGELSNGNAASDNTSSAWDSLWQSHYGGPDSPQRRHAYLPSAFIPHENPFYVALPYNDFGRKRKPSAYKVIYWAKEKKWRPTESMCKNRWVKITKNGRSVYAQWEDVGPFLDNDAAYVFGERTPRNRRNHQAGIDVSPAVRDFLHLSDIDKVDWQFVPANQVQNGPWTKIITTSQTCWKK